MQYPKYGWIHPEIDWEWFAFEALNIPATHPARDEWETFFIQDLASLVLNPLPLDLVDFLFQQMTIMIFI